MTDRESLLRPVLRRRCFAVDQRIRAERDETGAHTADIRRRRQRACPLLDAPDTADRTCERTATDVDSSTPKHVASEIIQQ